MWHSKRESITLGELEEALWRAGLAHKKAIQQRNEIVDYAVREFRLQTEKRVHADFASEILRLATAADEARLAYENASIDEAMAGGKYKYPIGTKMIEWRRRDRWLESALMTQTGRTGEIEVITRASIHPGNLTHSRASVGSVVIRLHTKSGKGTSYVNYLGMHNWRPEGVDPNIKTKGAE